MLLLYDTQDYDHMLLLYRHDAYRDECRGNTLGDCACSSLLSRSQGSGQLAGPWMLRDRTSLPQWVAWIAPN
jgi:hypothetical protein